jgi:hypothetical protein
MYLINSSYSPWSVYSYGGLSDALLTLWASIKESSKFRKNNPIDLAQDSHSHVRDPDPLLLT